MSSGVGGMVWSGVGGTVSSSETMLIKLREWGVGGSSRRLIWFGGVCGGVSLVSGDDGTYAYDGSVGE